MSSTPPTVGSLWRSSNYAYCVVTGSRRQRSWYDYKDLYRYEGRVGLAPDDEVEDDNDGEVPGHWLTTTVVVYDENGQEKTMPLKEFYATWTLIEEALAK